MSDSQRSRALDAAVFLALVLAAVASYSTLFLHVPILTEARDFLITGGWGAKLSDVWIPSGSDTRPFSWVLFGWQWAWFGYSAELVNLFQFLLLGLCGAVGYAHLRQLQLRPVFAALAAALLLASLASLHAAFWQATQHDKLGFLFTILALITGVRVVRTSRGRELVVLSAALTGLVILAMASKPIAFMLPGVLAAQVVLFAPRAGSSIRRAALGVTAPIVFGLLYVAGYLGKMTAEWRAHAQGGDIEANLLVYLRFLTNTDFDGSTLLPALLFAPAGLFWIYAIWQTGRDLIDRASLPDRECAANRAVTYLAILCTASIVILARAEAPVAFYVLIPAFAYLGTLAFLTQWLAERTQPVGRFASAAVAVAMTAGLLSTSAANLRSEARLGMWTRSARNFADASASLRRTVDPATIKSIAFDVPQDAGLFFYFFSGGNHREIDPALPSFIFERPLDVAVARRTAQADSNAGGPGDLVLEWSNDLQLAEGRLAGQAIFREPSLRSSRIYPLGETVDFRKGGTSTRYTGRGFSRPEEYGTWTDGPDAALSLEVDPAPGQSLELRMVAQAAVSSNDQKQRVKVLINDVLAAEWEFGKEPSEASVRLPREVADSTSFRISFRIESPRSPEESGASSDQRRLGILVRELQLRR